MRDSRWWGQNPRDDSVGGSAEFSENSDHKERVAHRAQLRAHGEEWKVWVGSQGVSETTGQSAFFCVTPQVVNEGAVYLMLWRAGVGVPHGDT